MTLLLVAASVACGPCFAQDARLEPAVREANLHDAGQPRSAFGKVMAVMISSLQRQSRRQAQPAAPVRTSAAGTPLGIEVGDAFRTALDDGVDAPAQATGTGGAAADETPRAAPPESPTAAGAIAPGSLPSGTYSVREAALAGPG